LHEIIQSIGCWFIRLVSSTSRSSPTPTDDNECFRDTMIHAYSLDGLEQSTLAAFGWHRRHEVLDSTSCPRQSIVLLASRSSLGTPEVLRGGVPDTNIPCSVASPTSGDDAPDPHHTLRCLVASAAILAVLDASFWLLVLPYSACRCTARARSPSNPPLCVPAAQLSTVRIKTAWGS